MTSNKLKLIATKQDGIFLFAIAVFIALYVGSFPQHIYHPEEVSHIYHLLQLTGENLTTWRDAISGKSIVLPHVDYPSGTSFFLLPFFATLGIKGLYIANLCSILLTLLILYATSKEVDFTRKHVAVYALVCIPLFMYSRVVSSEIPSLLFVASAFYYYFKSERKKSTLFLFGLSVGLSFWLQETILLLFIFPIVIAIKEKTPHLLFIFLGLCLGLVPRFLSTFLLGHDTFHSMALFQSFSFDNLSDNVSLFGIGLIFMFPFILYPLLQFQTKEQKLINISAWAFLIIHLFFDYGSADASGIDKITQASIHFIPAIPLFVISLCLLQKTWMTRLIPLMPWMAITATCLVLFGLKANDKPLSLLKSEIKSQISTNSILFFNPADIDVIKLLTPIQATAPLHISDLSNLKSNKVTLDSKLNYYLITYRDQFSVDRKDLQVEWDSTIQELLLPNELIELYQVELGQGKYTLSRLAKLD